MNKTLIKNQDFLNKENMHDASRCLDITWIACYRFYSIESMYDSTARNISMISFFMLSVKSTVFQIMKNVEMETPKNNMLTSSWLHLDIFPVIRVEIILTSKKSDLNQTGN